MKLIKMQRRQGFQTTREATRSFSAGKSVANRATGEREEEDAVDVVHVFPSGRHLSGECDRPKGFHPRSPGSASESRWRAPFRYQNGLRILISAGSCENARCVRGESANCSLNRWLRYTNAIRDLLVNAIQTHLLGNSATLSARDSLALTALERQIYDQQQNTAVVTINRGRASLWARSLWRPASRARERAARAYESDADPLVWRRGEKKRCKECMK